MIFQIWIESPDKSLKLVHFATCALTIRTCPFWSLLGIDLVSVKILSCEPKGPFPSPICACKIDIQFCDSLSGGQSILSGGCCCRGTCFPLLCRNINIIGVVNEINLILIVPIKSKWSLHLVHLILLSPLWNPWVSRDKRESVWLTLFPSFTSVVLRQHLWFVVTARPRLVHRIREGRHPRMAIYFSSKSRL